MAEVGDNQGASEETRPTLSFHPSFDKKAAGDVILQADDALKLCFYFRLARLAELSSFFAGLPPPSDTDLVDGTALIPLIDTNSSTLFLALSAVNAVTRADPFTIPLRSAQGPFTVTVFTIIDTAVFASKYDLPILYRLLLESISPRRLPFHEFFIWGMSGVPFKIAAAGEATVERDISRVPKELSLAFRQHIPACWMQLQDLHIRRAAGHKRFLSADDPPTQGGCEQCLARGDEYSDDVGHRYQDTSDLEEIYAVQEQLYGLRCRACASTFDNDYADKIAWIRDFTTCYDFDQTLEDYNDGYRR